MDVSNVIFGYKILKTIHSGLSSQVLLLTKMEEKYDEFYAGKLLVKKYVKEEYGDDYIKVIEREKAILQAVKDGPFMNKLIAVFEDSTKILFLMEYLQVKDFEKRLDTSRLTNSEMKFYFAEMIIGIEFLHSLDIIHRDIKPCNIGIDKEGHVAIIDFGLSMNVSTTVRKRAFSVCGTLGYIAPEVMLGSDEGYDNAVDWFSLGVTFYKLATGSSPSSSEYQPSAKASLVFPSYLPSTLVNLISKLLIIDPKKRLGGGRRGATEIKQHPFFSDVDWEKVSAKELEAPDITCMDSFSGEQKCASWI